MVRRERIDGAAYEALADKYREMHALRAATIAGEPATPLRMRKLAAAFPGALRELERVPLPTMLSRIEELEQGHRPRWARVLVRFHGWMRVALRIKRAFGRRDSAAAVIEWLSSQHRPSAGEPSLEELDAASIEGILRPSSGKLSEWLLERISDELEFTGDALGTRVCSSRNA